MFPIVKDHYLNDNKNIDNHLPYLYQNPTALSLKRIEYNKYDMYIFLLSLSLHLYMVEPRRIELLTSCVQSRRSPS